MASMGSKTIKLGLCQMLVSDDKETNIKTASAAVKAAAEAGAQIVSLPECWNGPYATSSFPLFAEPIPDPPSKSHPPTPISSTLSPSLHALLSLAKEHNILLIGGSIPEIVTDTHTDTDTQENTHTHTPKIYNTCVCVSPQGDILAKHRKVHLFDIDVPGKITFKESDTLTGGDSVTVIDTPFGFKMGIGICYDIRFPELAALMHAKGCKLLLYPGAFNLTTGPAHWELLQRARAVDYQLYVAAVSPARNPASSYQAWGHSTVVNPWGEVIATTGHDPALVLADLDMEKLEETRRNIPTQTQKRTDLYNMVKEV